MALKNTDPVNAIRIVAQHLVINNFSHENILRAVSFF